MRSPIRWFGGKGNFTQHLLPLIPEHKCYVEVFGGGASLLFAKEPSKIEIYNDLDGDVVAFFRLFHNDGAMEAFKRKCHYTPYSRELYKHFQQTWREQADPIERVYRWFMITRMSFNADPQTRSGFSAGPNHTRPHRTKTVIDELDIYVDRLRDVLIENSDWQAIIDIYDTPNTLFYCDPPYLPDTRLAGGYNFEMSFTDHEIFVDRMRTVTGKVLLSNYPNDLYETLGWAKDEIEQFSWSSGRKDKRGLQSDRRTECLWYNYEIQPTLF